MERRQRERYDGACMHSIENIVYAIMRAREMGLTQETQGPARSSLTSDSQASTAAPKNSEVSHE